MVARRELTDVQWTKIERLLPKEKLSPHGGRRRIDDREVMEGILGAAKRRTVERPAAGVSLGDDVLASATGVGRRWRVAGDLASLPVGA
jgi:hypothetical protein